MTCGIYATKTVIFSLVRHIVLIAVEWQMFYHAWLPIDKYKLYSYTKIET